MNSNVDQQSKDIISTFLVPKEQWDLLSEAMEVQDQKLHELEDGRLLYLLKRFKQEEEGIAWVCHMCLGTENSYEAASLALIMIPSEELQVPNKNHFTESLSGEDAEYATLKEMHNWLPPLSGLRLLSAAPNTNEAMLVEAIMSYATRSMEKPQELDHLIWSRYCESLSKASSWTQVIDIVNTFKEKVKKDAKYSSELQTKFLQQATVFKFFKSCESLNKFKVPGSSSVMDASYLRAYYLQELMRQNDELHVMKQAVKKGYVSSIEFAKSFASILGKLYKRHEDKVTVENKEFYKKVASSLQQKLQVYSDSNPEKMTALKDRLSDLFDSVDNNSKKGGGNKEHIVQALTNVSADNGGCPAVERLGVQEVLVPLLGCLGLSL